MDNQRLAKKINKWNPIGSRTFGRPKIIREDGVIKRIAYSCHLVQNMSFFTN